MLESGVSVQPAACVTCNHAGLHPSQVRFHLGCELCPPDCTPDQLGLEDEEILNVELKRHCDVCCGMLIGLVARPSMWLGLGGARLAGEAFRMQGKQT